MAEVTHKPKSESKTSFRSSKRNNDIIEIDKNTNNESGFVSIIISVERVENIDTCKVKDIMVKMEFDGRILCQTDKIPVQSQNMDVKLTGLIQTHEADIKFFNDILSNPILFTVFDCSTPILMTSTPKPEKDSKKRTSKTTASRASVTTLNNSSPNILGLCNLDIGFLLYGRKRLKEVLAIETNKNVPVTDLANWNKLPRLVVVASLEDDKFLVESLNEHSNVMGITIESVYNPPEHITEGTAFDAVISIPGLDDNNNNLVFPNGMATFMNDWNSKKKWCSLQNLEGRGGRTKYEICKNTSNIISTLPDEVDLENEIKKENFLIEWNFWTRRLLNKSDCNYFCSKLMKYNVWPVEIVANKTIPLKSSKTDKKSKLPPTESSTKTDHFTAFLNFSSLLYPGVTKARVAAQLFTYSQADLVNKFGLEFTPINSQASMPTISKSKPLSDRSKASNKEPEDKKQERPGSPVLNKDGLPTFIVVEIEVWKPFIRQRTPEYLEKELISYISLKGKIPKKITNFETAQKGFTTAIQNLVHFMSQEYTNFILNKKNMEVKKNNSAFVFYENLRCLEGFNKIIASLEAKVLSFIHEKYGELSQYNERIPDIYAALVDEMHKITNNCTLDFGNTSNSYFNVANLQLFAEEAMEEEEYELAKTYLLLSISKNKTNPDNWLHYAVFCIKRNDLETAVEATTEALTLDVHNQVGLLLYGLLMAKLNNGTISEITFQLLTSKYPYFIEGWKAFQLTYEIFQNFLGRDATLQMSVKLEQEERKLSLLDKKTEKSYDNTNSHFLNACPSQNEKKHEEFIFKKDFYWAGPLSWNVLLSPDNDMNIRTTILMLKLGFVEFGSMALSEYLRKKKNMVCPYYQYYQSVCLYLQGHYNEAIRYLEMVAKICGKNCFLWSLMGHCFYKIDDHPNAIACYEYVMESYNRPDDIHLIYLRMGYYYLQAKKFSCAKQVFAAGCKYSSSSRMWKGAGVACLRLNEYEEAETALGEANYLDNRDPETWGYLALVNGLLGREDMLKHCFLEAKKRNFNNQSLIDEIKGCNYFNHVDFEE